MISQIDVHRQISERKTFQFHSYWDYFSSNNNRRHIYNFNDYLHVEQIKNRIAQFFSHIYRRRTYDFVIVNIVKSEIVDRSNYWDEIMNSVLALFAYKLQNTQIVYDLFAVNDDILYLIDASYESDWQKKNVHYLLKCNWEMIYLWEWRKSFSSLFHSWRLNRKNLSQFFIFKKIYFWRLNKSFTSSFQISKVLQANHDVIDIWITDRSWKTSHLRYSR